MTEKRFLTTHVGSLPRPEALLDLVFAREGGEHVSEEAFDAAVEEATAYVIRRQIEAGISIVNDDLQPNLWYEINGVLGTAIHLSVTALTAET